jgi:NADP-dependent 3-hydroxy acid dehydrogenase YdfG
MHFAHVVAKHGAPRIALAARRVEKLQGLKAQLEREFPHTQVACAKMDVCSVQSIQDGFNSISAEFGNVPCNVVVNNAGISIPKPLLSVSEEEYDEVLDSNLKVRFMLYKLFLEAPPSLIPSGASFLCFHIVQVSARNKQIMPARNVFEK